MQIRNPRQNAVGTIDCEIEHPVHGWLPFTASPNDVEAHGREIYARLVAAEAGPVGEYLPPPPPTTEELARDARSERDHILNQSDKFVLPDRWAAMTAEQQAAWSVYRQALRDVPDQAEFPTEIVWPTQP